MAKRAFVRKGDRTTHGGVVVGGDETTLIYGRPLARKGDQVTCPRCKETQIITTGAMDMFSGQYAARHDDLVSCGARLIASQADAYWSDGQAESRPSSELSQKPSELEASNELEPHTVRFQSIHPGTGQPIPGCVYVVTRANGVQLGGVTDRQGLTAEIETLGQEQVEVHFAFKTPNGDSIDLDELGLAP